MESRRLLSTWLMLPRHWTGLQHVSSIMRFPSLNNVDANLHFYRAAKNQSFLFVIVLKMKFVELFVFLTFNINFVLLHRPDQVFWLWTWCSDPVWYQKRPLHRQWIPRGEQVAGHAWWVHQKICAMYRVWQPWNWSGKCLSSRTTRVWDMKYESSNCVICFIWLWFNTFI